MPRIRNIKPGFFKDSELFDAEEASGLPLRVAYAGLWTVADRAGRFKWKPREIGTDILPYDKVDMAAVLEALVKCGKIFKYKAAGFDYGYIPNFERHQFINRNEAQSTIPAPSENSNAQSHPEITYEYTGTLDTDILDNGHKTQDSTAQAPAPKPGRKVTTSLPENFPSADDVQAACAFWRERARDDLVNLVQDEVSAFRAHHTSHGKRMADWPAAWRTWYGNALKFNRKSNGNGPTKRSGHDKFFAAAASFIGDQIGSPESSADSVDAVEISRPLLPP